jgi:arylsulfatase A-like enzyme
MNKLFKALSCLLIIGFGSSLQANDQPNVIVILADDLGYGDVGYHGCKDIPTPHIDSIAHAGASFTAAYSAAPVCGPSRAGLLSGKYQNRFGYQDNIGPFGKSKDIELGTPLDIKLMPDYFNDLGYQTAMIGKWHDGDDYKFWPHQRGFDESYCFNNGAANNYIGKENGTTDVWGSIHKNGKRLSEVGEYLTEEFGRESVDFVERNKDKPFLLYLAYNAVHGPLQAPERYLKEFDHIKDEKRKLMAGMHYAMDIQIGKLLSKLKELDLEKKTIVIFTSDNGGKPKGNASLNGALRGQKAQTWDGGIRVPFCIQWKGQIPAGQSFDDPIHSIDILTTTLSAAKAKIQPEWKLEGVDLLPLLTQQQKQLENRFLYFRLNTNWAIRDRTHKLTSMNDKLFFSHISEDMSEKKNLLKSKPELTERFKKKMKEWDGQNEIARWGWNSNTCSHFVGYRNFKTLEDLEGAKKKKKTKKK